MNNSSTLKPESADNTIDEDPVELPADTLAILNEFLQEQQKQKVEAEQSNGNGNGVCVFEENWV